MAATVTARTAGAAEDGHCMDKEMKKLRDNNTAQNSKKIEIRYYHGHD